MPSARRPSTSSGAFPSSTSPSPVSASTDGGSFLPSPRTIQKRHSDHNLSTVTVPPRPPRNPARETKPKAKLRPSTATGTPSRDQDAPWEAFPSTSAKPMETITSGGKRADILPWEYTATGKVEDVLPWETEHDPPPTKPVVNGIHPSTNHPRHASTSHFYHTRSSISSSIHDMALLRRRKSTGAKAFPHVNGASSPRITPSNPTKSPTSSPKVLHKTPSASTVRPLLPKSASGTVPTLSTLELPPPAVSQPSPQSPDQASSSDPKFSTADRTILKELKRNINARAAQFIIKGGPAESGRAIVTGAKHHAYNRDEVPYPRSYAREVLDLDIWETMLCQTICESVTWHVFETPPTRVLDIGCGTGTWILNCGKAWRVHNVNSLVWVIWAATSQAIIPREFIPLTGLDVVPLHPNLGASELASRITWVQANFLEGLPFPNEEFDFVHIKRIALGVPEDKWDGLFEEIARILKPGGAFELIEEDLFFPGKPADDDTDSEEETLSEIRYARRNSSTSDAEEDNDSILTTSGGSRKSNETPNTSLGAMPPTPPRTASPLPIASIQAEVIEEESSPPSTKPTLVSSPAHPTSYRHSSYQPRIPSAPSSSRPTTSSSTASLHAAPASPDPKRKSRGYSTSTLVSSTNQHPSILAPQTNISAGGTAKPAISPFLLRTLPKAPLNPRDHSLLEKIYNEMNAARFINLSPLSLLANLVGLYFKDVRTHPPLNMMFPPPATQHPEEDPTSSDDDTDSDGARDAIIPRPNRRQSVLSTAAPPNSPRSMTTFSDGTPISDEHRWLHTSDLIKRESRYISLDESRPNAFSPSARSSFPALSPLRPLSGLPAVDVPESSSVGGIPSSLANRAPTGGSRNRLPNQTLNIDMRSLNMHLALRTAEVVACAESMWEWVQSYQKTATTRVGGRQRAGSLASEMTPRSSRIPVLPPDPEVDAFKKALLELSREDFDALLVRFDLYVDLSFHHHLSTNLNLRDMQDHMAIGSTLRDHFSWSCVPLAPSPERKAFNAACERWDQWQEQQRRKLRRPFSHQSRNSTDATIESMMARGRSSWPDPPTTATSAPSRRSSTTSSSAVPPDGRLSRSFRVFAAWKA
ncbi:Methyltransf-25 domain-containing protein [Mycena indigotica]|uniref:Methyltransf-25 domain-containing protein n=1 Tax=Mycena indigotica TaxID=2126181 RepID=A0A8H6W4J2_9AGAR|nr:Methyltransf-25 domain-containing protein [Mycena indigotica]KAF7299004.1 Methyltransf-25 domain-containing protein [Mycena indigotica]